jgi:uncharacterized membrane protein
MYRLGVALHVLGVAVWLGASLSFMIIGPASRRLPLESWANIWIIIAKVQRSLVGPACLVATVTGLLLTMSLAKGDVDMGAMQWLIVMQGFGVVAGILTLAGCTPMANRMGAIARRSLEKGAMDPAAAKVNKAFAMISSIAGAMVIVALYFGVAKP